MVLISQFWVQYRFLQELKRSGADPLVSINNANGDPALRSYKKSLNASDLPLIFHPAATGAQLVFTPIGAG
ncbi:MAG: hypothetical protein VX974_11245 [Pseudomonadota bacterium]|nr:hypothetical protein [Pseudomonadota bacterium]